MSIYSNKGKLEITGEIGDILTDLSMIVYSLKEADIPEEIIKTAIETGFEECNKKDFKIEGNERVKTLLKKLGLED